jgi:N-acetylmuramoyl-L-alanine amidase
MAAAGFFLALNAYAQPVGSADDAIGRVLRQEQTAPGAPPPATNLPVAPQKPAPAPVAGPAPGTNAGGSQPLVLSARIGEHEDRTRLVIELSDPVNLRTFTLTDPDRVVIDMPEVQWRLGAPPRPSGLGSVKSYRYGVFRKGNSRMVIDLNRPVTVSDALVIPPSAGFGYRVVIDLFPTQQGPFNANAGWPADLKQRETDAERLAAMIAEPGQAHSSGHKVVVIDPGHGGIDSGTSGVNGLMEKDLVLAEGLKLAKVLRAKGYTVRMTRDSDVFIPLPVRVALARKAHADLMISLHADSNPDSSVNGLSIYTLNDGRSDREAAALARRENQSDIIAGVDLSSANSPVAPILIDLAQRDTINRSSRFAETALGQLHSVTDILARSPHRAASLAVLVAPDVPAALIELGYLSNGSDAGQMNTEAWRQRVADAIANAVDRNFAAQGTLP